MNFVRFLKVPFTEHPRTTASQNANSMAPSTSLKNLYLILTISTASLSILNVNLEKG